MLFNTFQFAIFFGVVLLLHRALPRGSRNPMLLAASLLFYTIWIPTYLPLLVVDILVNYTLLRMMRRGGRPKLFLILSITFTMGLLAYFKYAAMIVESLAPTLAAGFGLELPVPEILLPLGISFYSFQIVAFAVDSYWTPEEAAPSLGEYALFIAFFPQLIAGPILRGDQLLPQITRMTSATPIQVRRGVWLLASGIAKKVVFADFLLAPFVDQVYGNPGVASAAFHWAAIYAFCFQIYFDFSGYTDMARGMALLLGFELPFNFTEPFLSRNPTEFWRRWHITLSRWLTYYLFIPMGGATRGEVRAARNLVFTMLLGGLWHGAGWNFVIWGGIQGLLLALHRRFGRLELVESPLALRDAGKIAIHFTTFAVTLVLFRSPSFEDAIAFYRGLLFGGIISGFPVLLCLILIVCAATHITERFLRPRLLDVQARCAGSLAGLALEGAVLGALLAVAVMVSGAGGEFIYFQF